MLAEALVNGAVCSVLIYCCWKRPDRIPALPVQTEKSVVLILACAMIFGSSAGYDSPSTLSRHICVTYR